MKHTKYIWFLPLTILAVGLFAGVAGGATPTLPLPSKGSLVVGSSTSQYVKLPVGADGLVLTASSGASHGVAWIAASGVGGGTTTINGIPTSTFNLSSANANLTIASSGNTITFTSNLTPTLSGLTVNGDVTLGSDDILFVSPTFGGISWLDASGTQWGFLTSNATDTLSFIGNGLSNETFNFGPALAAGNYTYIWPSKSGTVALTNDLTGFVTSTAGDWTGTWKNATSGTYYAASNPSSYINLLSLSGSAPITFNTTTGAIGITNPGWLTTSTALVVGNFASQNISQWTNDSSYATSGAVALKISTSTGLTTANFFSANVSQWTNDSSYATSGAVALKLDISASSTFPRLSNNGSDYTSSTFRTNVIGSTYLTTSTGLGPANFATTSIKQWNNDAGYVTSTGAGSVSTSSAITTFNFPYWATSTGGLNGTSSLSINSTTKDITVSTGAAGTSTLSIGQSTNPACVEVRDSDDGAFSYVTVKDGYMYVSTDSCGP